MKYEVCTCPHGYTRYTHGCRCEVCRAAKADYIRARRNRAREYAKGPLVSDAGRNFVPEIAHGIAGYQEHKCRCEVCSEAALESIRRQKAAKRRRLAADEVA